MYAREGDFQRDAKDLLDLILKPPAFAWHPPNEGKRSKATGGILKAQGMMAGAPDIVLFLPVGRVICFELKSKTGRMSDAQKDFRDLCIACGIPYFVVRTLAEIEDHLTACNVPTRVRSGL